MVVVFSKIYPACQTDENGMSFFFIQVKIIQVLVFDNWHPLNAYNHHKHSRLPKHCETSTCPDTHLTIHAWSRVSSLISNKSGGRNNVEGF